MRGGLIKRKSAASAEGEGSGRHVFAAPPSRGTGSRLGLQALAEDKRAARGEAAVRRVQNPRLMAAPVGLEFDLDDPDAGATETSVGEWQDNFGTKQQQQRKAAKAKRGERDTSRAAKGKAKGKGKGGDSGSDGDGGAR